MANQEIPTIPGMWSCNWNWCPETFCDSRDLGKHLQKTRHFNNKVKKRDLDAYLRSTEGRSGAPDSLLAAIPDPAPSMQSLSQDCMEADEPPHRSASGFIPPRRSTSESVGHRSPLPMTPPPVPPFPRNNRRNSAEIRAERQHPRATFNAYPSPGEAQRTNSPSSSSSQLSASDAKRRRMSFASYRAQSSPMSTPSVASVPPSPSLTNVVADAINRTGQLNAASPSVRPHSQSQIQSRKPVSAAAAVPPLPLPRRTSLGQSPSAHKPRSYPSGLTQTSSFHPPSQSRASPMKASSANSPGASSVGSAQAVEEALTQNVLSSASSRAPHNSSQSSGASSSTSSPRKHAQPQSQPSPHSSGGARAAGSHSQTQRLPDTPTKMGPLPDVKPVIKPEPELTYPHSESSSPAEALAALAPEQPTPPSLPRRRARSATPAQQPPAPTRTPRSRSRSQATAPAPPPAAVQSKSLPLPLPRTRSRGGSQTNTDAHPPSTAAMTIKGQRAGSKPLSSGTGKRAGSVGPAAGGRKGARANPNTIPGGLAAVDERPDETSQSAATQPQPQTQSQTQRPPTFRSCTLQLPRRQLVQASQSPAQPQSQSQSQTRAQMAAVTAGTFGEGEEIDVKVKRELDAEPLSGQGQSHDGGAWTGFILNPMELLTQKPFPSQRQSQSQARAQMAAVTAGTFGEDEEMDVKMKRELPDAEPLSGQGQSQILSQSQDGEA